MARKRKVEGRTSPPAERSPTAQGKHILPSPSVSTSTPADVRGLPAHDVVHCKPQMSLLSAEATMGENAVRLEGLWNCALILLFATNARLVIENLLKYGLLVSRPRLPGTTEDAKHDLHLIAAFTLGHLSLSLAYGLEKVAAKYGVPHGLNIIFGAFCTFNTATLMIGMDYAVRRHSSGPLASLLLLSVGISWVLKLVSFHHVCYDWRRSKRYGRQLSSEAFENEAAEKFSAKYTFKDFYTFIWMPTYCFQASYPRTEKVRWLLVGRHALEMMACLVLQKIIIEQYMAKTLYNTFHDMKGRSVFLVFVHLCERLLKLSVPTIYVWLLMFLAIFHHYLNILGELTRFADRRFYLDWWNAASFGEYWRKWNLPIHHFLNRHVNKPLLRRRVPKAVAGTIVFLISAMAHEYMVVAPLQVPWTGLVFLGFISQIPLVVITSFPAFAKHRFLGNSIFWITFCFSGQPIALAVYYYLWALKYGIFSEIDLPLR